MNKADDLRRRADYFDQVRQRALDEAGHVREDNDDVLGVLPAGGGQHAEMRVSWDHKKDRAPAMSVRLWTNEGFGYMPVRGVGFHVPFFQMGDFARMVAAALERSIATQRQQAEDRRRQGDGHR